MDVNKRKTKHGGARRGSGRKPLFDGPVMRKSIDLPESSRAAIETAAAGEGLSVHQWLVRTILTAVDHSVCTEK